MSHHQVEVVMRLSGNSYFLELYGLDLRVLKLSFQPFFLSKAVKHSWMLICNKEIYPMRCSRNPLEILVCPYCRWDWWTGGRLSCSLVSRYQILFLQTGERKSSSSLIIWLWASTSYRWIQFFGVRRWGLGGKWGGGKGWIHGGRDRSKEERMPACFVPESLCLYQWK